MTDTRGWFSVQRRYWTSRFSPIEEGRKFTRGEAFLYMISEAAMKDKTVWFNGIRVGLKRGDLVTSSRTLSETWLWGKDKVLRFLDECSCGDDPEIMVVRQDQKATIFRILKYEEYQPIPGYGKEDIPRGSKPDKKTTKAMPAPQSFQITESLREWATGSFGDVKGLEAETEKFLNHYRAKGTHFTDWEAAWKNWITKAHGWGHLQQATAPKTNKYMDAWKARKNFIYEGVQVPAENLIPFKSTSMKEDHQNPDAFKSKKTDDFDYFRNFEIE